MQIECAREQDVLDAIAGGRWSGTGANRVDPELLEHADACPVCRDVAEVAAALVEDRDLAWEQAVVPPSSIVWWRAQIRAREEAARAAARPIALAQAAAIPCVVAAALTLVPIAVPWIRSAAAAVTDAAAWLTPRAEAVSSAFALVTGTALPILPFAVASMILAPIVVYFALTEE